MAKPVCCDIIFQRLQLPPSTQCLSEKTKTLKTTEVYLFTI